jgi:hypothetical protein
VRRESSPPARGCFGSRRAEPEGDLTGDPLGREFPGRVGVFLADLADFAAMNETYRRCFREPLPARTTVGVDLPAGMKVEIDAMAVLDR